MMSYSRFSFHKTIFPLPFFLILPFKDLADFGLIHLSLFVFSGFNFSTIPLSLILDDKGPLFMSLGLRHPKVRGFDRG